MAAGDVGDLNGMKVINIHQAKTHLSRLVDEAVKGESFVIAKAGKPMVEVRKLESVEQPAKRLLGALAGKYVVPDDIKTPFREEIEEMFYGEA
jgi:prevent-host-death family protein